MFCDDVTLVPADADVRGVKVSVRESSSVVDEAGVPDMMSVDAVVVENITNDGEETDVVVPVVNKTADDLTIHIFRSQFLDFLIGVL
jgi:hypothetical protein